MQIRLTICRLWVAGCFLAGGGFLYSCQPVVAPQSHLNQETISIQDLLDRLIERQSGIKDLKSFVYTTIETNQRKQSVRQAVVVRGNDSLRIDTLNLLGQPLGVYIYNGRNQEGQRSTLFDPTRNQTFLGQDVKDTLAKTLGMDLNLADFISVFYGNIPRLKNLKMTKGSLGGEGALYWLTGVDPVNKSRIEIEMDAYTLLPEQLTRTQRDQPTVRVLWRDYREVNGREFPHQIVFELPDNGDRLTLVYADPIINSGIPDDTFQLPNSDEKISALRF